MCCFKMPSFYAHIHRSQFPFLFLPWACISPFSSYPHIYLHAVHHSNTSHASTSRPGLDFVRCLVHRQTRQVFFLGSTLRPLLPLFCPHRPMWHLLHQFSTLFRHSHCILHFITFCITNISLCMDDLYSFTVDIVQCLLGRLQCYILYKCQAETTRSSLTSYRYHHLLRSSFVKQLRPATFQLLYCLTARLRDH